MSESGLGVHEPDPSGRHGGFSGRHACQVPEHKGDLWDGAAGVSWPGAVPRRCWTNWTTACWKRFYLELVDEFGRERQATISTYLAAVRAFLRHCLRSGVLDGVELERAVERLRAVRDKPGYRTPRVEDGLALIVDYVKNELPGLVADSASRDARLRVYRDRALLLLLFTTGMRRREAARLDRRDVDDGSGAAGADYGKGRPGAGGFLRR